MSEVIEIANIQKFITERSSFEFEMNAVELLRKLNFDVEHSGSYQDPSTQKYRQFDIRAKYYFAGKTKNILLPIECKKLSEKHPLIISCSKRREQEDYHFFFDNRISEDPFGRSISESKLYPLEEYVGRAIDQYSGDSKIKSEELVRDKFNQAIQSASAWLPTVKLWSQSQTQLSQTIIFPCVVVPNELLWVAKYDENGKMLEEPARTDRIPIYQAIAPIVQSSTAHNPSTYSFSHLEILTLNGLELFWNQIIKKDKDWKHIFPN